MYLRTLEEDTEDFVKARYDTAQVKIKGHTR
jgi:hypothetical protein